MNVDEVLKIDYRFSFDPMFNNAPDVFKTQDTLLRFSYAELYKLRMFFKKYGTDADFYDLEDFDFDFYDETYDYLEDNLNKLLRELYPKDMLEELHPSIEDYYILWPEDLIDDVMNDDFLNWGAIADALLLDRIELEAERNSEKG
jgi:hypothetical protein